jgi:hypothetical protein
MSGEWTKVVVSGSQAELKSLHSEGTFEVSGSLIILKGLPTIQPTASGRLWNDVDADGSWLKIKE